VIALEQRQHFLARGAEQFRDLVNPNRCQIASFYVVSGFSRTFVP
jgi:hypothetical protein